MPSDSRLPGAQSGRLSQCLRYLVRSTWLQTVWLRWQRRLSRRLRNDVNSAVLDGRDCCGTQGKGEGRLDLWLQESHLNSGASSYRVFKLYQKLIVFNMLSFKWEITPESG